MPPPLSEREITNDLDPIDRQLHRLGAAPSRVPSTSGWQAGLGLGWSGGGVPVVPLLLLGSALGPRGLALLTRSILSSIDAAIPVALAALGIFVGLDLASPRTDRWRLLGASIAESAFTGIVVGAGMLAVLLWNTAVATLEPWTVALAIGICASTSSALRGQGAAAASTPAQRVIDLDALVPIVASGLMLAWIRETSIVAAIELSIQSCLVALVIAVAAWLLLSRTTSETEQLVFGAAALLLLGGVADYLAIAYLLVRTSAKLTAGALVTRMSGSMLPATLGCSLVSPGIFGVALAMSAPRSLGPDADGVLTIAVVGTIASQLVWSTCRPREDEE